MDKELFDLYTDYLITSTSHTTATGLSDMLDNIYSHDKITRFLSDTEFTQKDFWAFIKPVLRSIENDDGVIIIDDTIENKPYSSENDIISWHFDHTKGRSVKGINIINFMYQTEIENGQEFSLPLSFEVVVKDQEYIDNNGKKRRRSKITKNEMVRNRLKILAHHNRVQFKYIIFDSWYCSKENMKLIKKKLNKDLISAIKCNRLVALSCEDKLSGKFVHVSEVDLTSNPNRLVYLKGMEFPVLLTKQIFKNEDGSVGTLYLVSSDTELTYHQLTTIYRKRWKVEEFHKSLKQNASLEKSPTKIERTQRNHIFASMGAFIKLEKLKIKTNMNHFALKSDLYIKAIKTCFNELQLMKDEYDIDNCFVSA